ncbi:TPA: type VI secretion system membrane subunit TssM [Vibrio cholerae]|nr:type VI secretion system membrane subunit TssM [Vibrio cholerae]
MMKKLLVIFLLLITWGASAVLGWYLPSESSYFWMVYFILAFALLCSVGSAYFFLLHKRRLTTDTNHNEQQILLKQDTKIIQKTFKLAVRKIRGKGNNRLSSLYEIPWYLVLGGEKDAKSSLLQQNSFEVLLGKQSDESDNEHYIKFWSNDLAVVIEVGHRIFDNDGIDEALWAVLGRELLKYRPRQGVNGIISLIGCDRLLQGDPKDRQKLSSIIQEAVLLMNRSLKLSIPVYSIFSKADTIADFVEFFESYSVSDLDNPFGLTFPCDRTRRFSKSQFEEQSNQLLCDLAKQQIPRLRSISSDKASSVIALPYQLRIVFERINELMSEIGRENRVREAVWLRGAYLLSCGQKGHEFDLLTQVIAERAQFNTLCTREQLPSRRTFFSPLLFKYVILPERQISGVNKFRHTAYFAWCSMIMIALITTVLSIGEGLKNNWNQDEQWRADAIVQMNRYVDDRHRLKDRSLNVPDIVAILSELRSIAIKGIEPKPWYKRVSIKQNDTAQRIYSTYEEQLNIVLLPKLEELISNDLYVYVNLGNPIKIFDILRYYQMLFDKKLLNLEEIQSYLVDNLKDQGVISSDNIQALVLLLEDLFHSNYQYTLKANNELISVASNNLEGLSPERLIYARIRSMPEYRNQVDIRHQLGDKFDSMFVFSEQYHGYLIPEIFTKQGYSELDLSIKSELIHQQLAEFKSIQGDLSGVSITEITDLSKQLQRLYFADYIHYWKELIRNIHIKSFDTPTELLNALRNAREPATSPILDVIEAIVINTTLAVEEQPDTKDNKKVASQLGLTKVAKNLSKIDRINRAVGDKLIRLQPSFVVNESFLGYSNYINGTGKANEIVPLDGLIQEFDTLNSYFDAALSSQNPAQVMHNYAVAHAKGSQDAIVFFERQSAKAPSQVALWTKSIAQQAWKKIIMLSMEHINKQWDEQIYQFYNQAIEGRFPFTIQGRGEVALEDFTDFFKPQGKVDKFVDEFLKPFVYWENGILKLNYVNGYPLPISTQALTQLSQTRQLSQLFFGSTGQALSLKIALRPSFMNTNVTEFQLRETDSIFTYRHGPRVWSTISWPSTGVDGYISTNFYQGENRVSNRVYNGQWAIFRALFDGDSSATKTRLVRKLNYKLNDNNIVIDYTLTDVNQELKKEIFNNYLLPKSL